MWQQSVRVLIPPGPPLNFLTSAFSFLDWTLPAGVLPFLKASVVDHISPSTYLPWVIYRSGNICEAFNVCRSWIFRVQFPSSTKSSDSETLLEASVESPMSGILVATPSSTAGPSPRNPPSPGMALSSNNERSAMTFAVQENLRINRARLFVQKYHKDLLRGMDLQEQ